jgi:phosphatidate cytidylyltransferase
MNELTKRILFALIAGPAFIWMLSAGGYWFQALIVVITVLIQLEVIDIARKAELAPNRVITFIGGMWIALMPFYGDLLMPFGWILFVSLVMYETMAAHERNIQRMFSTFFCTLYAPAALATFSMIRFSPDEEKARALTLLVILGIWGVDTLSYFGGRLFGKHLLAEKLSPKKTWEGFFSGLILGGPVGALVLILGYNLTGQHFPFSWIEMAPVLFLAGTVGPVGDLAESKLKRSAGVKDSGTLLPGHGGLFDRFDSLLLTAPAVYVYAHWILKL